MAAKPKKNPAKIKKVKPITVPKTATKRSQKTARVESVAPLGSGYDGPRRLKRPTTQPAQLPSVFTISKRATTMLWGHKKLFAGIVVIYGLLNLVLVKSLSSTTDISSLKSQISAVIGGNAGKFVGSVAAFSQLVGAAGNGNSQTAGAYQLFLGLLVSLAAIWALRQSQAGVIVRIRDSFYRGMYPLIPFILVLLVIGLQLLPFVIGTGLYEVVTNNGIAITGLEKSICGLIALVLSLLSLFMVSSSVFALYIVTLPDMTPITSLRSAKKLVRYRRWTVVRKVLFLPLALLIVAAIIMLPIILVATALAQWVFFILTMFGLIAIHAYMYTMYRELLNE